MPTSSSTSSAPKSMHVQVRELHANAHAVAELAKDIDGGTLAVTVAATLTLADDVAALEMGVGEIEKALRARVRGAFLGEAERLRADYPAEAQALEAAVARVFGSIEG